MLIQTGSSGKGAGLINSLKNEQDRDHMRFIKTCTFSVVDLHSEQI